MKPIELSDIPAPMTNHEADERAATAARWHVLEYSSLFACTMTLIGAGAFYMAEMMDDLAVLLWVGLFFGLLASYFYSSIKRHDCYFSIEPISSVAIDQLRALSEEFPEIKELLTAWVEAGLFPGKVQVEMIWEYTQYRRYELSEAEAERTRAEAAEALIATLGGSPGPIAMGKFGEP